MSTTYSATWVKRTSASTRYVSSLVWKYWDAFQERRDRQKLRSARRLLRKQFCASLAQASFHTAWVQTGSVAACTACPFTPRADIVWTPRDVRKVPKSEVVVAPVAARFCSCLGKV